MTGPIGRRRRGRPALSSLIAGMFVFVMLFTVGTGYFIFVNTVNGTYDRGLSDRATALQAALSESLSVSATAGPGDGLTVSFTNRGGVTANVTDILVVDPGGALHGFGLGFGSQTTPPLPAPVDVASTSPEFDTGLLIAPGSYTVRVVTQLGNTYVATYPTPLASEVSTLLSSFVVTVGGSVFDTALLSGVTPTAGGTVTYSYFSGGLCEGGATLVSTVPVTNATVPDSAPETFSAVGSFSWDAVYSGDSENSASSSLCEPLAVTASPQCVPSPSTICPSTVSQGLGAVAIDWNSFRYYSYASCGSGTGGSIDSGSISPPTNSCALSPAGVSSAPLAYTISDSSWRSSGAVYHVFSVNVTNADPLGRTMNLDGWTQLWFSAFNLGSGGGRANSEAYGMVLVRTSNGAPTAPLTTLATAPSVTIPYGQTATLFFSINQGGDPDNYGGGNVTPIFMLFHGTLGAQAWTENFPLAATFWLP